MFYFHVMMSINFKGYERLNKTYYHDDNDTDLGHANNPASILFSILSHVLNFIRVRVFPVQPALIAKLPLFSIFCC